MIDRIARWLGYEKRDVSVSDPDWSLFWGSNRSRLGTAINTDSVLSYSPIWQGVDLITSDISRMPLVCYRRVSTAAGDGKERAREHPAFRLLRRHTGEMTANMWLVRMVGHALLYGNAYSIMRYAGSELVKIEWVHSDRVEIQKIDGELLYLVNVDPDDKRPSTTRRIERVAPLKMFHLQGLAVRQLGGLSIIEYARNMIARSLAAEGFTDDYFANGGPGTLISHPGTMSEAAQKNFLRQFRKEHTGDGNRFRFGVIEEGMKVEDFGIKARDAMLVEMLQFSVKDAARFLNVPPHKLGDDSRTSFNSVEQENRSYFNSSLGKWTSRIEFEANEKCFLPSEKQADSHFAEFITDALFKANTVDRMTAAQIAVQNGIKSRNEVRAEENLNPYDGGDEYLTPLNMTTDQGDSEEEASDLLEPGPERYKPLFAPVMQDAFARATNRIFQHGAKYGRGDKFPGWVNSIDLKHREPVRQMLEASLRAIGRDDDGIEDEVNNYIKSCVMTLVRKSEEVPDPEVAIVQARQEIERSYRKQIHAICEVNTNA